MCLVCFEVFALFFPFLCCAILKVTHVFPLMPPNLIDFVVSLGGLYLHSIFLHYSQLSISVNINGTSKVFLFVVALLALLFGIKRLGMNDIKPCE